MKTWEAIERDIVKVGNGMLQKKEEPVADYWKRVSRENKAFMEKMKQPLLEDKA